MVGRDRRPLAVSNVYQGKDVMGVAVVGKLVGEPDMLHNGTSFSRAVEMGRVEIDGRENVVEAVGRSGNDRDLSSKSDTHRRACGLQREQVSIAIGRGQGEIKTGDVSLGRERRRSKGLPVHVFDCIWSESNVSSVDFC